MASIAVVEEPTAAQIRDLFYTNFYNTVPTIRDLELFLAIADTLHDFIRGFRNKPKGGSAAFVETIIETFLNVGPGAALPDYMKTLLRSKKNDIEDSVVEWFETKANLPFIGPRDMNASETHDELLTRCRTVMEAVADATIKRGLFESYELKPGKTEIKRMSKLEKSIILAFSITFLFGAEVPARFFVDGPAKRVRLLLQLSDMIRGLFMPQTMGDSAATTFKPLTATENLYAFPTSPGNTVFVSGANYFTRGLYQIGYEPVEGTAFTDKSRFAWNYVIDGSPSGKGNVRIQYGTRSGQPSEGPSVDQLLELQMNIGGGSAFTVGVDKPSQLNLTTFMKDGGPDGIVADLRRLTSTAGVSLLFDIKRGGDYDQVDGGDLISALLKYVGMISPDRLAILKARMRGLPAWQHNGDHFKLFKTRLREKQLSDEELAAFKREKTIRQLLRSTRTVSFFCNYTARAGLLDVYQRLIEKIGTNNYLNAKISDIQNYLYFILFYSVKHTWCAQAVYDESYNDLELYNATQITSRILSEITRNLDVYRKLINGYSVDIGAYISFIVTTINESALLTAVKEKIKDIPILRTDAIHRIIDSATIEPGLVGVIVPAAFANTRDAIGETITNLWRINTTLRGTDPAMVTKIIIDSMSTAEAMADINGAITMIERVLTDNGVTPAVSMLLIQLLKSSLLGNVISNTVDTICAGIKRKIEGVDASVSNGIYHTAAVVVDEFIGGGILSMIDSSNKDIPEYITQYSLNFLNELIALSTKPFNQDNIHDEIQYSPVRAKELNDQLGVIRGNISAIQTNPDRFPLVDLVKQIDTYNSLLIAFCNSFYNQSTASRFYQNNCITVNFDRSGVIYSVELDGEDDDEGDAIVSDNSVVSISPPDRKIIKAAFDTAITKRRDESARKTYRDILMKLIAGIDLPVVAAAAGLISQGGGSREGADLYSAAFTQYGGDHDEDDVKTFEEVIEDFLYEVASIINGVLTSLYPRLTTYARLLQLTKLRQDDSTIDFVRSERDAIISELKRIHGDKGSTIGDYKSIIDADLLGIISDFNSKLLGNGNDPMDNTILSVYTNTLSTYYNNRGQEMIQAALEGRGDGIYIPPAIEDKINGFMLGEVVIDTYSRTNPREIMYPNPSNKSEGFLTQMTMKKAISLTILYDLITYDRNKVSYFSLFFPAIDTYGSYITQRARYTLTTLFDTYKGQNLLVNSLMVPFERINVWVSSAEFIRIYRGGERRTRRRYSRRRYNRSRKQQRHKRMTRRRKGDL